MKTLILLLFAVSLQAQCLKADIILVGDLSASVKGYEYSIYEAFNTFLDRFQLSNDLRVGLVTFNSDALIRSKLTSNRDSLDMALKGISHTIANGTTALDLALDKCTSIFLESNRDVIKIVVLISDGSPDNEIDAIYSLNSLKTLTGAGLCTIFVNGKNSNRAFLSGLSDCYTEISSFDILVQAIKRMDVCL